MLVWLDIHQQASPPGQQESLAFTKRKQPYQKKVRHDMDASSANFLHNHQREIFSTNAFLWHFLQVFLNFISVALNACYFCDLTVFGTVATMYYPLHHATIRDCTITSVVVIHCMNHRLELAAKSAFADTYMEEVSQLLMNLYYTYEKSPKRLREFKAMADLMEDHVRKPEKASGTRWVQHKSRAVKSLILGYSEIASHLRAM